MSRTTPKQPINAKWEEIAARARDEAARTPPGRARDALLAKANQLDTARHINQWVSSPGLRPPVDVTNLIK